MNEGSPDRACTTFCLKSHQTKKEENQILPPAEADDNMGIENGGSFPEFISAAASQSEALQTKNQNGHQGTVVNGFHSNEIQSYSFIPPKTHSKPITNDTTINPEHKQRKPVSKDQIIEVESVHPSRHCNREAKLESLEQYHVHDVYEKTAHHFKDIRLKAWPKVKQFLLDLEPGSIVADIGE